MNAVSPGLRGRRWCLALAVLVLALLPVAAWAETAASKEYQLKAVFLLNFTKFVEWPAAAIPAADAPITIGILGEDPFGTALDETLNGETVRSHHLVVRRATRIDELRDCQVLFICASERNRTADVLAGLGNHPVLSVSDIDGFASNGGVIGFYRDGNRIRFEINPAVARVKELKISAQLLKLGRIVGRDGGDP